MSEVHHWPKCAVCSERWGEPTAVEEYEIPPGDVKHAEFAAVVVFAPPPLSCP